MYPQFAGNGMNNSNEFDKLAFMFDQYLFSRGISPQQQHPQQMPTAMGSHFGSSNQQFHSFGLQSPISQQFPVQQQATPNFPKKSPSAASSTTPSTAASPASSPNTPSFMLDDTQLSDGDHDYSYQFTPVEPTTTTAKSAKRVRSSDEESSKADGVCDDVKKPLSKKAKSEQYTVLKTFATEEGAPPVVCISCFVGKTDRLLTYFCSGKFAREVSAAKLSLILVIPSYIHLIRTPGKKSKQRSVNGKVSITKVSCRMHWQPERQKLIKNPRLK